MVIERQSEGHGVTPIDLSTKPGQPQGDGTSELAWIDESAVGPWAGGGMAGALEDRQKQRLEALGVRLLEPNLALEALGELTTQGASGAIGVLDVDWARISRNTARELRVSSWPRLFSRMQLRHLVARHRWRLCCWRRPWRSGAACYRALCSSNSRK
jgi:hypothetical protein